MAAAIVPGKLTQQLLVTRNPDDGVAYLEDVKVLEYSKDDATATLIIPASAADPVYVTSIVNLITEAFAGGTATIDVGDGSTAAKYLANGSLAEGTVGDKVSAVVGAKLVANAKIVVTIGAGNTTGKGALIVHLFRPDLP
jgi:hypothetical protein